MSTDQRRILYIEDNPDNQRLVRRVLSSRGYVLDIAPDGMLGLQMAQAHTPDLILMDINLPGLTGYELATKFKALPPLAQTPIIAITANTTVGDRERALAAGCDGYISKPIDPRELPQQIAAYLGGVREELPTTEAPTYMREYSQQLVTRLEDHVRELEAANIRLMELDQAKNDFLATISHELRTPLTVIHGYIDLMHLQALGPMSPQQQEAVALIRTNSHRLLRHINDLIYLQQVRTSEVILQETNLNKLVRDVCKDIQEQVQVKQISFFAQIPQVPPLLLMLDDLGVENAIRHLLENAVLYTAAGGSVQITLMQTTEAALIEVKDSGMGIPEADLERIFEPFVRLDNSLASIGGAGLGLVIAKHVAEAHQGKITVKSTLGKGSVFTLQLPKNLL